MTSFSWFSDYLKKSKDFYRTGKKFGIIKWYDVDCIVIVVRRHIWFPDNNFSSCEWISLKFSDIKVQYHKRQVGIEFGDDGPNCLGIRGPKGPKTSIFLLQDNNLCISISIALKLYHSIKYHKEKVWVQFWGYCTNSLENKGQKTSIFVVSGQ